jgi:hypothetical protein
MTTLLDRIYTTYLIPSPGKQTHLVNVVPTSLSESPVRKEGSHRERCVLYLPGRLATFITLDPVTGIHGCHFYNVVHDDDGWFLGGVD